ncbi:MAG TPA: S8 family serine peptidase [Polyangia bacterium]|nr:S8 family serine peptidase [Polyangia bacterium]
MPDPNTPNVLQGGKRQFLIAARRDAALATAGLRPFAAGALDNVVQNMGLDIVRVHRPAAMSTLAASTDVASQVYVASIDPDRAQLLQRTAPPQMIVEEDAYLGYGPPKAVQQASVSMMSAVPSADVVSRDVRFIVLGEGDKPLPGIDVTLVGDGWPAQGTTDANGQLKLTLSTLPGSPAKTLFAAAKGTYWDRYVTTPQIDDNNVNVIRLQSIAETIDGFPAKYRFGWGAKMMGLDALPETLDGSGVRVAIIDSGADITHPLLQHITTGIDLTNNADRKTWAKDVVGHGSHCAGTIAARSAGSLRGFSPGAEIHVLKIFPGGQFSSLLDALDYCIANQIDIVNMSLGSPQPSQIVEQKLQEAVANGVFCVVAAGNSGGPVQYPASSPNVLAVSAIGLIGAVRAETWDSSQVNPRLVSPDGVFSPTFTCYGPEVAVCAPGVSIISTVPGGYESQSGTSMAAPYISGLATLLLAHHPLFQPQMNPRGAQRVHALASMIRQMCTPYALGQNRTGMGLPRVTSQVAGALQPGAQSTTVVTPPQIAPQAAGFAWPQAMSPFAPMAAGPDRAFLYQYNPAPSSPWPFGWH